MASRPILRYAAAWLAAGALVVGVVLAVHGGPADEGGLPPVHEPDLATAVRRSGCLLRAAGRDGAVLNPPVDGRPGQAVPAPGAYERPLRTPELVAAVRRGIVVIQYRADLAEDVLEDLRQVQRGLPAATILVPNATRMPFSVAAVAHRRLLGCRSYGTRARDAVRLFHGRFVGSRPRP